MTQLRALIWDVDGTIAETERDGHRVAFNQAFEASGLAWCWDDATYGDLLRITGAASESCTSWPRATMAPSWRASTKPWRARCTRSRTSFTRISCIATTTSRSNIEVLLQAHLGTQWAEWFPVMVCGEDVHLKKPDPEAYVLALRGLKISPLEAVAIEDSPGGVAAARAADVPVVVALSSYFASAAIEGAIAIGPGLQERHGWRPALLEQAGGGSCVRLGDIEGWHAQRDSVSQYV